MFANSFIKAITNTSTRICICATKPIKMKDILLAFKMKYGTANPEHLLKAHRVKVFLDKVDEWAKVVMEKKNMNKEDKELFLMLQEASSDLVHQIELEKEKVYGYACIAHEMHQRNEALVEENRSLKEQIENLTNNISTML